MKVYKGFALAALLATSFCLASCKSDEDPTPFTGIRLSADSSYIKPGETAVITGTVYIEDVASSSDKITYSISSDTSSGAYFGAEGTTTATATSGEAVTVTAGSTAGVFAVTAVSGEYSSQIAIGVINSSISASDTPVGYAEIDTSKFANTITVSTKSALVKYAKAGGYLIYVNGMIDMSDGMLPSTAGGTTTELDSFVKTTTSNAYETYTDFRDAYAKSCSDTTEDGNSDSTTKSSLYDTLWKLNRAYGNTINLSIKSNTAIIGLTSSSGIKGGSISISGVSNVVLRNLTIQDAYDPFPHHEVKSDGVTSDGFNAQRDNISIQKSENIWVDHCTVEDTMKCITVTTKGGSEKWQTYDGLCDITNTDKNVVVSYNIFRNHDKTMLIGNGSKDINGGYITIHHNEFLNCGQRLPMTTYPNMHIYNNIYLRDSNAYYSQQACIVGRYSAYTIVAENNYFGSGVTNCFTTSSSGSSGKCYASGNYYSGSAATSLVTSSSTKPFTPSYAYSLDSASTARENVLANAGAGVWSVKQ